MNMLHHTVEAQYACSRPCCIEQRTALERMARQRPVSANVVERARIVLLAAERLERKHIARRMGKHAEEGGTLAEAEAPSGGGIAALERSAPQPSRPRIITVHTVKKMVEMMLHQKPANAAHWSTRTNAVAVGIGKASVRRIWRRRAQPHRTRTFELSNDPEFVGKLEDLVGLYLNPSERVVVLCGDGKS